MTGLWAELEKCFEQDFRPSGTHRIAKANISMPQPAAQLAKLAAEVTNSLSIPTIGIGAGRDCSGQVLVLYDLLGVFPGKKAKFVRNFMDGAASIQQAVENYVRAVKDGSFPGPEHSF